MKDLERLAKKYCTSVEKIEKEVAACLEFNKNASASYQYSIEDWLEEEFIGYPED